MTNRYVCTNYNTTASILLLVSFCIYTIVLYLFLSDLFAFIIWYLFLLNLVRFGVSGCRCCGLGKWLILKYIWLIFTGRNCVYLVELRGTNIELLQLFMQRDRFGGRWRCAVFVSATLFGGLFLLVLQILRLLQVPLFYLFIFKFHRSITAR